MTKNELRSLYSQQMLVEAVVEPSLSSDGWIVEFRHARGGLVPLTDGNGIEQCFGDVDMATENALEIGFHQVRIVDA
ncbi:thymidylate kinase [Enterovibrio coralii]|uniref:Thymidylate kinase n=1 Tax=Enterovibrio coralii TaxID=294935 RepID=A0A135I485_9GAMM|nr:thymidylate kinase [Enterovibrio coralii]KXF80261.1 thymidylate kinase [Enterovibrio coralii]